MTKSPYISAELFEVLADFQRTNAEIVSKLDLSYIHEFSQRISELDFSYLDNITQLQYKMNVAEIVELSRSLTTLQLPIDIEIVPEVVNVPADIPEKVVIIYKNQEKKLPNKIATLIIGYVISGFISGCFQTPTAQDSLDDLIKSVIQRYEDAKENISIEHIDPNQ